MSNLYSNSKVFHFKDHLDKLINGGVSSPIHIRLKPINRCNHNCYYCCYRTENLLMSELMNEEDMIPREKMLEIIKDMKEMGVRAVTFTGGGEPLIYPHINEAIEKLFDAGIKVATLTNGSTLKGKTAELLAEGAAWVRISIDAASPELYSKNRGVGINEFSKICKNIENFSRINKNKCQFGINFIVDEKSQEDVYSFIKLMKELGVNHVKVTEAVTSTDGEENNRYHKLYFNKVKKEIERASETLADSFFSVIDRFHDLPGNYTKEYSWCPFINFLTVIAADLNIYTCQDKAYTSKGIMGSIKDQSFQQMWRDKATQNRLRSLNPSTGCDHHCVQHGKNIMLHDYLEADPIHLDFV